MKLKHLFEDWLINLGLCLITASALSFAFVDQWITNGNLSPDFGLFFLNYSITAIYTVMVLGKTIKQHRLRLSRGKIEYTILMLILWFISAFSLNRDMNVFDTSVTWLTVWICLSCITLIFSIFKDHLPRYLKLSTAFLLGLSTLLFIYYAIYLTPLYVISAVVAIGLGISLHTYVPLFLGIITIIYALRFIKNQKVLIFTYGAGIVLPLICCIFYIIQWKQINSKINFIINHTSLNEEALPAWVIISRQIPRSALAERIIKSDLVYKTASMQGNLFWGDFRFSSFDEPMQHDPLVIIASLFSNNNHLSEKERINILQSMYNSRHKAQERLWSGDKLQTVNVITNIQIQPEYRLAYTEKTISIANTEKHSWRGTQEAIYSFHLPEGAVVTSLSLWIAGKEEKAILTSKSRADSAYHEIVGVEQHDPSVVHWQEGNTVSVRIFPCTSEENRKFKIGITSPLKKNGDKLIYQNPYFEGPETKNTTESVRIAFSTKPGQFNPDGFQETKSNVYETDRDYNPYWEITCLAPQLSKDMFSFSGSGYKLKEYQKQLSAFEPAKIYADINSSWSEEDLKQLQEIATIKPVYVFQEKMTRLTDANFQQVCKSLSTQNFSLFPVYKITDPKQALLLSKSTDLSPNLADLEDSDFQKKLSTYLSKPVSIHFYNLGDELSPYLKALKEFRILDYDQGTFQNLKHQLSVKQFPHNQEDEKNTLIGNSEMVIEEIKTDSVGSAPDHLMRLYAYNDIMKKAGKDYFNKNYIQASLIKEAASAYVVSPLSSLIVLETQKDYDRFNITDSKNSLKNASIKSSGAVPEPQEWMLILMALAVVIYLCKPAYRNSVDYGKSFR